jgi:uncharacterized protein (TIGR03086 family)
MSSYVKEEMVGIGIQKSLLESALDAAEPVIAATGEDMFGLSTPCAEWDVRQLLNHLYGELAWIPELLGGKTIEQVGDSLDGDLVGGDLHRTWRGYADAAKKAAEQTPPEKVVHLSYGNVPASAYLDEVASDVIVHTWDLAMGTHQKFHIRSELALAVYDKVKNNAAEWRNKGLLGPEIPVAANAAAELRLLGLFGRRVVR